MSTNVFNSSAMAAVAAAALGTGASRHHHSAMVFTPTPVAGTSLGLSSSPTAFPFPPPSPLFLPSLNLLQSPQASTHSHLQPLSPWISPNQISSLSTLGMSIGSKTFCDLKEFGSDNNNNNLSTSSAQNSLPSTPSKTATYRSLEHDISGNDVQHSRAFGHNSQKELKSYGNGLIEFDRDKSSIDSSSVKSYSPSKPHSANCAPGKLICLLKQQG